VSAKTRKVNGFSEELNIAPVHRQPQQTDAGALAPSHHRHGAAMLASQGHPSALAESQRPPMRGSCPIANARDAVADVANRNASERSASLPFRAAVACTAVLPRVTRRSAGRPALSPR
jgi:hypothetical protein